MSLCIACWQGVEVLRLPVLESITRQTLKQSDFYKQSLSAMMMKPLLQYILILMGLTSGDPKFLKGEIVDEDLRKAKANNDTDYIIWYRFCSMKLAFIFSDFDLAESLSDTAAYIYKYHDHSAMEQAEALFYECVSHNGSRLSLQAHSRSPAHFINFCFHRQMTLLAQVQRGKCGRFRTLRYVRRNLKRLKMWAENAPSNFLHKQYLLQAEIAVTVGDKQKARAHYRSAILLSRDRSFYLEEALANEHLGHLYLKESDFESAVALFKEARQVYEKWGAKAKVEHFEREHREVLNMSL
jgi:tetratricopeptide (TPR) repeat protein